MDQPQQPPNTQQEHSEPPSRDDTTADPAATLSWIDTRLKALYASARQGKRSPFLDRKEYLDLYTTVHNFMLATLMTENRDDATLSNRDLYNATEGRVREHCRGIRGAILAAAGHGDADEDEGGAKDVIAAYNAQWTAFVQLTGFVVNVMQYLERHWILRELDERSRDADKGGIYVLRELHEVVWREEVLKIVDGRRLLGEGEEEIERAVSVLKRETGGDQELVDEFEASLKILSGSSSVS